MKPYKDSSSELEDEEIDVDSSDKSVEKKHKRHKHKKHRKKKVNAVKKATDSSPSTSKTPSSKSAASNLKLKIKLEEAATNSKRKSEPAEIDMETSVQKYVDKISQGLGLVPGAGITSTTPPSAKTASNKKRKAQKKDSETSSEEERWLDAIQSGKLDEVDEELKKIKPKDPKLMTARQRAMLERKTDREPEEQLMALPSGYKEVVMTAEAMQRKAIKSQKRKQKADEKREKDKKKTMERLLKKQESKSIKSGLRRVLKKATPQLTYRDAVHGPRISVPHGFQFPMTAAKLKPPPHRVKCAIQDCDNFKKFSCSRTNVPLCSLKCYKKNLADILGI